ncbi:MAG TPA: transposase [Thermoanaerobaculia bacterium]|nr:transposase [Thermoanaerobaculia bacterium]
MAERARLDAAFALRFDRELDSGRGACILREYAPIVAGALQYFDGSRYELRAWCVMPNHVHVLLHVERGDAVPKIVHSWKSFTAHAIGRGVIWQREYFDRLVRGVEDYGRTTAYIRANPAKAGLGAWPWVG